MKHCDYCGGSNPVLCDGCARLERTAREQAEWRAAEAEAKLAAAAHLVAETYAALDAAGAPVAIADARGEPVPLSLAQLVERLRAEIARLRGILPELPPRPPNGNGLPRYGLRWNGPTKPLAVPIGDGYWTPWHLAHAEADRLRARVAELEALTAENQRQCVEAQEAQLRLSQDIATERAARAQAEGRYESAAEMVATERAGAEAAERRIAALESVLRDAGEKERKP